MPKTIDRAEGPPKSVADLLVRLDHVSDSLPKRLRQCADYLRANINQVAVTTVAEMATLSGVAPSALMRFCQALGFSGYSEMQAMFRTEYAQSRPDYAERLSDLRARGSHSSSQLLADFVEAGHKSLIALSNMTDIDDLEAVIAEMKSARMLHLVGMRRAFPVVSYMGYMLQKMAIPCMVHSGSAGVEFTSAILPDDVVFAVTFAPFAAETQAIAQAGYAAGAKVVVLTDSADCPLGDIAHTLLIAREVDLGAFRVPTASMTLVTTLAVALGGVRSKTDQTVQK